MLAQRVWWFSLLSTPRDWFSKRPPKATFLAGLLGVFLILVGSGCGSLDFFPWSGQTEIRFETIEQRTQPKDEPGYTSLTLSAAILTSRDELERIRSWISGDAFLTAEALNFDDFFCIAVFQGQKPGSGYEVDVDKLVHHEDEISIQVAAREPTPGAQPSGPATSPYHLVKIKKDLNLRGFHVFHLIVPGRPNVIMEKIIP